MTKSADRVASEFYDAVGKFLAANGWKALVVGGTLIQGTAEGGHRYELVVKFMGGKKAKPTQKRARER